jgi:hypothetical protein
MPRRQCITAPAHHKQAGNEEAHDNEPTLHLSPSTRNNSCTKWLKNKARAFTAAPPVLHPCRGVGENYLFSIACLDCIEAFCAAWRIAFRDFRR